MHPEPFFILDCVVLHLGSSSPMVSFTSAPNFKTISSSELRAKNPAQKMKSSKVAQNVSYAKLKLHLVPLYILDCVGLPLVQVHQ